MQQKSGNCSNFTGRRDFVVQGQFTWIGTNLTNAHTLSDRYPYDVQWTSLFFRLILEHVDKHWNFKLASMMFPVSNKHVCLSYYHRVVSYMFFMIHISCSIKAADDVIWMWWIILALAHHTPFNRRIFVFIFGIGQFFFIDAWCWRAWVQCCLKWL